MSVKETTSNEIDQVMEKAWNAFHIYRKKTLRERADFLRAIAKEVEACGVEMVETAMTETNLPKARLEGERTRTIFQLNNYADACERGDWLEARIDTGDPSRTPPKPDIRKMLVPLGPVVVFGASNFPFAYSTAGGDTACAFAAGCPVIVKAHPAHIQTSDIVSKAIERAATTCNLPEGIYAHVHAESFQTGQALITHRYTKAVGFTGSFIGGKALFDLANKREEPIPVFAEMGSINPVFLLPEKLKQSSDEMAQMLAGSVTLSVGQFCTNPGLIIGVDGDELNGFIKSLGQKIKEIAPATMLHQGIHKSFLEKRKEALSQKEVETVAVAEADAADDQVPPTLASATGQAFLNNPVLHKEVFGPYSLIIRCKDIDEMVKVAKHSEGQLTATLMATENDFNNNPALVEAVTNICGRFILNGVPTGVEVCQAMHHGGPFPATTDSRFTSVGADGIKRFARPVAYQNWPDSLLPEELRNDNPLNIWRTVNGEVSKERVA